MQATRMSQRDEVYLRAIKNEHDFSYADGAMRIASKWDRDQYICFMPFFTPGTGEIDLAPEPGADMIDRRLYHFVEIYREAAIRHLLHKEAMDASAA